MWHTNPPNESPPEETVETIRPGDVVYEFATRSNDTHWIDAVNYLQILLARVQYAQGESETERICALNAFHGDKTKGYYYAVARMMTYSEMEQIYYLSGELARLKRPKKPAPVFTRPWGMERNVYRCCGQAVGYSEGCWKSLTENSERFVERPYLLWWDYDMTDIWSASTQAEMIRIMQEKTQIGTAFLHKEMHHKKIQEVLTRVISTVAGFMLILKGNMERNIWKFPIDAIDPINMSDIRALYDAQYAFNDPFHMCKVTLATATDMRWYAFLRNSVFGQEAACKLYGVEPERVPVVVTPPPRVEPERAPVVVTPPPRVEPERAPVVVTPPPPAEPERVPDSEKLSSNDEAMDRNIEIFDKLFPEFKLGEMRTNPNVKFTELKTQFEAAEKAVDTELSKLPFIFGGLYAKSVAYNMGNKFKDVTWKIPDNLSNAPNATAWPLESDIPKIILYYYHNNENPTELKLKEEIRPRSSNQEKVLNFFHVKKDILSTKQLYDVGKEDYAIIMFMLYALDKILSKAPFADDLIAGALFAAGMD